MPSQSSKSLTGELRTYFAGASQTGFITQWDLDPLNLPIGPLPAPLILVSPEHRLHVEFNSTGAGSWSSRFIYAGGTGDLSPEHSWKRIASVLLAANMPSEGIDEMYRCLSDDFIFYISPPKRAITPPAPLQSGRMGPVLERPRPRFELD
jgi:hypothetical protein